FGSTSRREARPRNSVPPVWTAPNSREWRRRSAGGRRSGWRTVMAGPSRRTGRNPSTRKRSAPPLPAGGFASAMPAGRRALPAPARLRPAATALVSSRNVRRPPRLARDGQALAALRSPRCEHLAAALGLHSRPEAVGLLAMAVPRAIRALHGLRNLMTTMGCDAEGTGHPTGRRENESSAAGLRPRPP